MVLLSSSEVKHPLQLPNAFQTRKYPSCATNSPDQSRSGLDNLVLKRFLGWSLHCNATASLSASLSGICIVINGVQSCIPGSNASARAGAESQPGWSSLRKQPVSASMLNKFQPFLNHILRFRYRALTVVHSRQG